MCLEDRWHWHPCQPSCESIEVRIQKCEQSGGNFARCGYVEYREHTLRGPCPWHQHILTEAQDGKPALKGERFVEPIEYFFCGRRRKGKGRGEEKAPRQGENNGVGGRSWMSWRPEEPDLTVQERSRSRKKPRRLPSGGRSHAATHIYRIDHVSLPRVP